MDNFYGQLPTPITEIQVDCKEMMFFQYLPIKLIEDPQRKITLENRLEVFRPLIGCLLFFVIFYPIIAGIEITNSRYEEQHKKFMKQYEASWDVFPTKTDNEVIHDEICPQLNEAGHNYKDCKIWNKTIN